MISLPPFNCSSDAVTVVAVYSAVIVAERFQDFLQLFDPVTSRAGSEHRIIYIFFDIPADFAGVLLYAGLCQCRLLHNYRIAESVSQAVDGLQPRDPINFKAVSTLCFTHGFPRGVSVLPVPRRRDAVLIQQILQFLNFFPAASR